MLLVNGRTYLRIIPGRRAARTVGARTGPVRALTPAGLTGPDWIADPARHAASWLHPRGVSRASETLRAAPTMPDPGRPHEPGDLTLLLADLGGGDRSVLDRVLPLAYEELRRLAHSQLARERRGHTLDTTALVHEAYIKLAGADSLSWKGRAHFFAVCAQAMRRVLVNYAEARKTAKRGGTALHVPIEDVATAAKERPDDILWVDEALRRLEQRSARQTRVVECRVFAGMDVNETAEALSVSPATVKRDWAVARAWLIREADLAS